MKVLAFGASNSSKSINKQLAAYTAGLIPNAEVEVLDLNDFEMPLYSVDREQAGGVPDLAQQFLDKIGEADVLVVSFAEHNGSFTAAYKNLFDWVSRLNKKVYQGKPTILLSTSPGKGGAGSVFKAAQGSAPYIGMDVKAALSVPSFYDNFDVENGVVSNPEIRAELEAAVAMLQ